MYITLLMQTVDTLRNVQCYVDPYDGASMHRLLTWLQRKNRLEDHLLYRVAEQRNACAIYVQSDNPLNTNDIERYGFISCGNVCLTFDKGRTIEFSMRVHPTVAHSGKPEFLKEPSDRMAWCVKKLAQSGLDIQKMIETGVTAVKFHKTQKKATLIECCDVAGIAIIENPEQFRQFVQHGVGRLKNYGAGMFVFN